MLFLIANTLSFAEVPHSYVTENPKKEIQKVETFKQREKAELNLSVTKLKTKEIEGKLVNGKLVFDITDKKDIQEGNILVTQGTPYKPNNARIRGTSSTQVLKATKESNRLEVTGENLQDVYVNVLDSKGQLTEVYKNSNSIRKGSYGFHGRAIIEIDDDYEGGYSSSPHKKTPVGSYMCKGMKVTYTYENGYDYGGIYVVSPPDNFSNIIYKIRRLTVNNKEIPILLEKEQIVEFSDELIMKLKVVHNSQGWCEYGFLKFPQKDFVVTAYIEGDTYGTSSSDSTSGTIYDTLGTTSYTINFKYIVKTLKGNSTLKFAEYYPVNEFVQFTANPTIQNAQPLGLDNSVRDVTLETTGKGLVAMQQGDKLTVDGHEVVIGAGGNIGPQKLTIRNVKYTYEVKDGKFRIALNEWGVLEPNRTIPIKIVRTENGKDKSLAEHNLTIKAPRRVEGTSNVKLNQDYSIRNTIRFNGISLQGAGALGLENPIPLGVSLTSTAGQGIPFMKEGDRLEISDGLTTRSTYSTRGVKAFTIGPNGTLGKQQVKLNNGELTVFVEGGKLRVGVNNWLVNNTINSSVRLVRGTNEIMNHTLDIKVPEAPFNVKKNGLLDFGNVTAGSKRTAETDIVLEMLQDVSDVKFSLKDPQPMLENLGTGDNLKVNRIEYLVSKQGKRDYKVKLKGNLTIPEGTKSGLYTGSTVLELKIK